ncbi:MAG: chemotaxis protein CheB [Caldilinea sp. CFX5]|nr:chemotaxis protein CheB [Caldilinea sp. CFX5]
MHQRDIIVIGGSSGSIEALKTLVAALSPTLSAALFVVVHMSAESPGLLPDILDHISPLPVVPAEDRAPIRSGHLYVAAPNRHLLVEPGWMRLTCGPKENRFRPAIDPLFRSAAYAFGPQVIGIVLSGLLDDGTAGLWAIKDRGGVAMVQEPQDALYPSMPQSALRYVAVDHRLPMGTMAAVLNELVREPLAEEGERPMSDALAIETKIALADNALQSGVLRLGKPSFYTCPDCHGVLVQIEDGEIVRYRCHTGHAYSQEALLAEVDAAVETSLWNAVRTLDEKTFLLQQMAQQLTTLAQTDLARRLTAKAAEVEQRAQVLRQVVQSPQS